MCSRATAERLFLLPIAVKKPWEPEREWLAELEILPKTQASCEMRAKLKLDFRIPCKKKRASWEMLRYNTRLHSAGNRATREPAS